MQQHLNILQLPLEVCWNIYAIPNKGLVYAIRVHENLILEINFGKTGRDVTLSATTEIEFNLEKDVSKVIGNHFNRIFRDEGIACRFKSKATGESYKIYWSSR
jgi:hypothetical protein